MVVGAHDTGAARVRAAQHAVAVSRQMAAQVAADSSSHCKFQVTRSMCEGSIILSIPCSGAGRPLTPASLWAWPSYAHGFPHPAAQVSNPSSRKKANLA